MSDDAMTDDARPTFETSLLDLTRRDWLAMVEEILAEDGYVKTLGPRHHALFAQKGATLLVSFETLQGIQALSDLGQPLGWDMMRAEGWSQLCLMSRGDTWFRDQAVYAYFDQLIDDGFFDAFDTILFYGAGPCAYAAAAFSVAAPGARVLAVQPQATLDPRMTEWDDRFTTMRMQDFNTRYGFAPDMLDAADQAYVLYDPAEQLDAMHAALFTRPNVAKLRMRLMGDALQSDLLAMGIWAPLLKAAATDTLSARDFGKLSRVRRNYRPYLRKVLNHLKAHERTGLMEILCTNVTARMGAPFFKTTLENIQKARKTATEGDTSQTGPQTDRD